MNIKFIYHKSKLRNCKLWRPCSDFSNLKGQSIKQLLLVRLVLTATPQTFICVNM